MSNRDDSLPEVDAALAWLIAEQRLQGIHLGERDKCGGHISKCWNVEDEEFGERKIWWFKCLRCGKSVAISIKDIREFEDRLAEFAEEVEKLLPE